MVEKLLKTHEAAHKLAIGYRSFTRKKAKLKALGMEEVSIDRYPRYTESSIDKVIRRIAERGGLR